ncbi:MAG: Uma2 family endonuclease [Cyanobacteria bacterium P01_F01_bin.150]
MTVATARWTLEDYHQMIAVGLLEGRSVELLNGLIVEMSPESPAHAQKSTNGADHLRECLGRRALIRDAKPITLPSCNSEPEPDIAVVVPNREVYCNRHPYPDDIFLLIEYANTSLEKDLNEKRKTYAKAGIQEYWVVDLNRRQVLVLRQPQGGDYTVETVVVEGDISPIAFPDITVKIKRLL